jgi:hypothetical protein
MDTDAKLNVTIKTRLLKYAEGCCPENADPFETIEKEITLTGAEAAHAIKQFGGDV